MINESNHFVETLQERTTLFQAGNEQVIWEIPLNTIDVDAHEVDEYLADGWFKHPFDVRDAQAAEAQRVQQEASKKADEERLKKEDEEKRIKDEQGAEAERARLKRENDEAAAADNALKEKLLAQAEKMGLKVDKRWGTKTLQEAIDEAGK